METYIYTLADSTGIRYVGKSDNPEERFRNHLKECTRCRTKKERWIFSLKQQNLSPVLEILEIVNVTSWSESEMYWIAQLKAWGFNILNGTDGGEGSNGFKGKKHTEETKEKCRLAALKRTTKTSMKGIANKRAKLTEEQVIEIKSLLDIKSVEFAKKYNVSKTLISEIRNGKKWNHILPA